MKPYTNKLTGKTQSFLASTVKRMPSLLVGDKTYKNQGWVLDEKAAVSNEAKATVAKVQEDTKKDSGPKKGNAAKAVLGK